MRRHAILADEPHREIDRGMIRHVEEKNLRRADQQRSLDPRRLRRQPLRRNSPSRWRSMPSRRSTTPTIARVSPRSRSSSAASARSQRGHRSLRASRRARGAGAARPRRYRLRCDAPPGPAHPRARPNGPLVCGLFSGRKIPPCRTGSATPSQSPCQPTRRLRKSLSRRPPSERSPKPPRAAPSATGKRPSTPRNPAAAAASIRPATAIGRRTAWRRISSAARSHGQISPIFLAFITVVDQWLRWTVATLLSRAGCHMIAGGDTGMGALCVCEFVSRWPLVSRLGVCGPRSPAPPSSNVHHKTSIDDRTRSGPRLPKTTRRRHDLAGPQMVTTASTWP